MLYVDCSVQYNLLSGILCCIHLFILCIYSFVMYSYFVLASEVKLEVGFY